MGGLECCEEFFERQSAPWVPSVTVDTPDGAVEGSPSRESSDSDRNSSLLIVPGRTPLASAIELEMEVLPDS